MTITLVEDAELYTSDRSLPVADHMVEVPHSAVASAVVLVALEAEALVAAELAEAGSSALHYVFNCLIYRMFYITGSGIIFGNDIHIYTNCHFGSTENPSYFRSRP